MPERSASIINKSKWRGRGGEIHGLRAGWMLCSGRNGKILPNVGKVRSSRVEVNAAVDHSELLFDPNSVGSLGAG